MLIAGPAGAALAYVWMALGQETSLVLGVIVPMTLLGLSFAVLVAPLTASVMSSVDQTDEGLASGINNAASGVAQLAGVALAAGVASFESGYEALGYTRACRPDANRELLVDQTFVSHTHGAAGDAELRRQISPRGQSCA
jgi:predicted MFS family arabinose efflux permease